MATILILVGTESGNAQMVADALQPVLASAGHAVDITDKAATAADLQAHDVLLAVCATHGSGDIPTNILPLVEALQRDKPDLSGHRYGVIALGDMTYQDTFCGGGKKVDQALELCGARRVGDRLEIDASEQPLPDEEALAWIEGWKTQV
jgi:MioC protein